MKNTSFSTGIFNTAITRTMVLIPFGALLFILAGCGYGKHDVSNDPSYGNFKNVIGVWKTKVPMYLVQENDTDRTLFITEESGYYNPSDGGLLVLPIGTELRIERLIKEVSVETDIFYVNGSLIEGQYAGKSALIHHTLFINNAVLSPYSGTYPQGRLGWAVASDMLEK